VGRAAEQTAKGTGGQSRARGRSRVKEECRAERGRLEGGRTEGGRDRARRAGPWKCRLGGL
jgi:hypothetical protein